MPRVKRGEIWEVDLGLAAKVRPCVLMSRYPADDELALIVVIPHTTAIRGNRWEFAVRLPFLELGVFQLQQIQPVSLVRLIRKLGACHRLASSNCGGVSLKSWSLGESCSVVPPMVFRWPNFC